VYHYVLYEMYDDQSGVRATPHDAALPVWRRAAAECLEEQVNTASTLLFSGDLQLRRAASSQERSHGS
jgi:hypothetical protein